MKKEKIGINIWDDYYSDEDVPEGEIQETYAYVEHRDLNFSQCKSVLVHALPILEKMINDPQVKLEMFWYDSRSECLPGDSEEIKNAKWHFQRWQIQIKHLTHENLENLVEQLNSKIWEYLDKELIFYSES